MTFISSLPQAGSVPGSDFEEMVFGAVLLNFASTYSESVTFSGFTDFEDLFVVDLSP